MNRNPARRVSAIIAALLLSIAPSQAQDAGEGVRWTVPTRKLGYLDMRFRQLMLDHYVVARIGGDVEKIYPQARLDPAPMLECEGPHELESMALSMPSTVYDPVSGKYQMWWYNIWHGSKSTDGYHLFGALGYAESKNGLDWTKPVLNQLDYKGHGKANNCIAGIGPSQWVTSVVRGHDSKIRCYTTPRDGTAILADGIRVEEFTPVHWQPITNMPEGRVEAGPMVSDLLHVMYDPVLKRYLATVRTFAPLAGSRHPAKWRRAVALFVSEDGVEWTDTKRLVQTDLAYDEFVENLPYRENQQLPAWGELHDLPLQRYESLIVGLDGILFFYSEDLDKHTEIAGTDTAYFLSWSRDGFNWSRPFERKPLLDLPHGSDEWGRHTTGSSFFVVEEKEIRIYHDVGRGHTNRTYKTPKPKQIRLSRLRRDGFAGYKAGKAGGWVETAPFVASGELKLNVDASNGGEARVEVFEVVEESEVIRKREWKALPGFGRDDSRPTVGDQFSAAASWDSANWRGLKANSWRCGFI